MINRTLWAPARSTLTILILLAILIPLSTPGVQAGNIKPEILTSTQTAQPGEVIRVTGRNFPGAHSGIITWGNSRTMVGMVNGSSSGAFTALVQVPDVIDGSYQIETSLGGVTASLGVQVSSRPSAGLNQSDDPTETSVAGSSDPATETETQVPDTATIAPTDTVPPAPTETATNLPPTATPPDMDTATSEPQATATDTEGVEAPAAT
ncbi:MAG TPA: hypothetical protein PK819_11255, partial [Thermomicrobiales bacterium]|nr:hypothetical protein [Thermomicrobiales bacterium]